MAWSFHAADEDATEKLGMALATCLPRPALLALFGTLGAGKTRLVRAIASGLSIDPGLVTSPTFVLVHEYPGETPLFHFDAYRLRGEEEFWQLGAEDYFADPHGITVVEWADRVAACLPPERLNVSIEIVGPTDREFSIEVFGQNYERALEHLKRLLVVGNS